MTKARGPIQGQRATRVVVDDMAPHKLGDDTQLVDRLESLRGVAYDEREDYPTRIVAAWAARHVRLNPHLRFFWQRLPEPSEQTLQ